MNRSKDKGTRWESLIAGCLQEWGFEAERRALEGSADRGDIAGLRGVVIEAKAEGVYDIPAYLREAKVEKANADAWLGVVWMKLRGKANPLDAAVIMSGEQFVYLLRVLRQHGVL